MTFVRPLIFLTAVTVLCAVDLWAVAGLCCLAALLWWLAPPAVAAYRHQPVTQLRRRQLDTVVERQEVRR